MTDRDTIVEGDGASPRPDEIDRTPLREDFVRTLTWILNGKTPPVSHRELAEGAGLGAHTRLYRWLNLKAEPLPHEVFAMERFLKVPHGTLSLSLGYLPPEARSAAGQQSVEEAVNADPFLPEQAKRIIRLVIAEFTPTDAKSARRSRH